MPGGNNKVVASQWIQLLSFSKRFPRESPINTSWTKSETLTMSRRWSELQNWGFWACRSRVHKTGAVIFFRHPHLKVPKVDPGERGPGKPSQSKATFLSYTFTLRFNGRCGWIIMSLSVFEDNSLSRAENWQFQGSLPVSWGVIVYCSRVWVLPCWFNILHARRLVAAYKVSSWWSSKTLYFFFRDLTPLHNV